MRKNKMQKRLAAQGLQCIVMAVFLLAVMGLVAGQGLAAMVDIGADGIFVEAGIDQATALELRVAGPGGFHDLRQSNTGTLEWNLPAAVADGEYRYEVFILVGDEPEKGEDVEDSRELQYGNGRFVVEGGMIRPLEDSAAPAGSGQQSLIPSKSWLSRIVQMVGDFLVPSAQAANLTAAEHVPSVLFDDYGTGGGSIDWEINADIGYFRVYDNTNACVPFYAEDNSVFWLQTYYNHFRIYNTKATGDSIYLDDDCGKDVLNADSSGDITLADGAVFIDKSANNMGIGTITPTENLHIVDSYPGIFLDDTSGGDIKINQTNGELSVVVSNGAHNGEILTLENDLSTGLYPGLGIWEINPESPLHVGSHDNMSAKIIVENPTAPTAAGDVEMFALENAGNKIARFKIQAGGGYSIWTFDNEPTYNGGSGVQSGRFRISKQGSGVAEFTVDGFGNGVFYGKSYATQHINTSARAAKTDFTELSEQDILAKLMQLPVSQWRYKQEDRDARHIGPVAEDFQEVFGLGDGKHISTVDSEGIALAAIKAIKTEKDAEIMALKEENRALLERLNALEELVRGSKVTQLMQ